MLETKEEGVKADDICGKLPFSRIERVNPEGFKGGIWLLWNDTFVNVELIVTSR